MVAKLQSQLEMAASLMKGRGLTRQHQAGAAAAHPAAQCGRHHQHPRLLHRQRRLLRPEAQKGLQSQRVALTLCQLQMTAIMKKGSVPLTGIRHTMFSGQGTGSLCFSLSLSLQS